MQTLYFYLTFDFKQRSKLLKKLVDAHVEHKEHLAEIITYENVSRLYGTSLNRVKFSYLQNIPDIMPELLGYSTFRGFRWRFEALKSVYRGVCCIEYDS